MRTRLSNMTWSNLRFNVWRSFVTMATNLPSCFSIQFLEQLLKFLVNFTLLKYVKSQRNYGFLITKELIFGFQILDLKDHFSASLSWPFFHPSIADNVIALQCSSVIYPHLLLSPSHFQNSLSTFSIERVNGIPLWNFCASDFQRALKIIIIAELFIAMTISPGQ